MLLAWDSNLLSILGVVATVISLTVGVEAWRHRPDYVATGLATLMAGVGLWAFCDAMLAGLPSPSILLWNWISLVGAVTVPGAWLLTILAYTGYEENIDGRLVALFAIEPVITLVLAGTPQYHDLFWVSFDRIRVVGTTIPVAEVGIWYWLNVVYSYLLILAGIGALVQVFLQSGTVYRKQSGMLAAGAVIPVVTNLLLLVTVPSEVAFQVTTVAFAATGVLFGLALYRLDLLELEPVARDTLVERMNDGMLVVDEAGRVVDANPAALKVLDGDPVGRQSADVLPGPVSTVQGTELTATVDGRVRTYRTRVIPFGSRDESTPGWLVTLVDITDVREREQRLEVLNRALRHNIRNDMSIVLGTLELLEDRTDEEAHRLLDRARSTAEGIVDMSEKARLLEQTLFSSGERAVDVTTIVRRVGHEFAESHPDVDIDLDMGGDEPAWVWAVSERHLEAGIENLIENAIEHNDADEPRVTAQVDPEGDTVRIEVADNGPGIPEMERAVLTSGQETPLEHGSGLGLWLVYWVVTAAGGDLSFAENEPRGSVVTVELRRAPEDGQ